MFNYLISQKICLDTIIRISVDNMCSVYNPSCLPTSLYPLNPYVKSRSTHRQFIRQTFSKSTPSIYNLNPTLFVFMPAPTSSSVFSYLMFFLLTNDQGGRGWQPSRYTQESCLMSCTQTGKHQRLDGATCEPLIAKCGGRKFGKGKAE